MSSNEPIDGEENETTRHRRLLAHSQVQEFITSGRAIFTVLNTETRNRGTFRVEYGDDVYEVFAFTGSDNWQKSHYTLVGWIRDNQSFSWYTEEVEYNRLRAAVESDDHDPWLLEFLDSWRRYQINGWEPTNKMVYRYRATCRKYEVLPALTSSDKTTRMRRMFSWVWSKAHTGAEFGPSIEIWHEGTCCRCGKRLTVPASIELGMGADCAKEKGYFELWQKLNSKEAA